MMLHADVALVKNHLVMPGEPPLAAQVAALRVATAKWILIANGIGVQGVDPFSLASDLGVKTSRTLLASPGDVPPL